jgi:hypothetical protein
MIVPGGGGLEKIEIITVSVQLHSSRANETSKKDKQTMNCSFSIGFIKR